MSEAEKEQALILRAVKLKEELFRIGLYQTAHRMDEVTKSIGWEVAERIKRRGESDA